MMTRISWAIIVAVVLAGCGNKEPDERTQAPAQQQQPAQQATQTPEQPPNPPEADERRPVPATNSASAGEPPRVAPDQKSDIAARGAVANPPVPAQASPQSSAAPPSSQPGAPAAEQQKPAAAEPAKAAPAAKQQPVPTKPIVLKDGALGAITFQHATHKVGCATCHHPSREPKPLTSAQQACTSCHTKPVSAGMKTARQAAFHDPRAQSGTCIDCHKKSGGKAPVKCADCHKKA